MQWDYRKLTSYRFCYFSISCLPWRNNGRVAWQKVKVPRIPFKTKFGAGLFSFQNCHFWRRWHLASLAASSDETHGALLLNQGPAVSYPIDTNLTKNGNSAWTISGLQPEVRTYYEKATVCGFQFFTSKSSKSVLIFNLVQISISFEVKTFWACLKRSRIDTFAGVTYFWEHVPN